MGDLHLDVATTERRRVIGERTELDRAAKAA